MAEIPSWLRSFPLGRTPYFTAQDSGQSKYVDNSNKLEQNASRIKSSSWSSSSYLDNGRANAPSRSNTMDPVGHVKEVDGVVWHNPNPHQMAETLKVVMMTKGSFEPLPVQYNSCILHVLEAYHDMRLEIIAKERKIREEDEKFAEAMAIHQNEEAEWMEKEEEYKAELRKLEILLAGGERGLDLVTLARSQSTIRKGKKQAAKVRDQKIESHCGTEFSSGTGNDKLMTVEFSAQKDARVSALLMSSRNISDDNLNALTAAPATCPVHQGADLKERTRYYQERGFRKRLVHHGRAADQRSDKGTESFDSKLEGNPSIAPELRDTAWLPYVDENFHRQSTPDNAICNYKHLPKVANGFSNTALRVIGKSQPDNKQVIRLFDDLQEGHEKANNLVADAGGFSFVPGDDGHENLSVTAKSAQQIQRALEPHPTMAVLENEPFKGGVGLELLGNNDPPRLAQAITSRAISSLQTRDPSRDHPRFIIPQRNDSQSSVVTAVRDNSCRSETNSMSGHGKPNRHDGSSEATIAAARAIASSHWKDSGKLQHKVPKKDSHGQGPHLS